MAFPLAVSLNRIAREAVIATQIRSVLASSFGQDGRVTQLDIDYGANPIAVRTVIVVSRSKAVRTAVLASRIETRLKQPVKLRADQVLVDVASTEIDQERAALEQAQEQQRLEAQSTEVGHLLAAVAGTEPSAVMIDRDARRALVSARLLPSATLATYRALEQRVSAQEGHWTIVVVPPAGLPLPPVRFADDGDTLDDAARPAVLTAAWAAARWNWTAIAVPALREPATEHPALAERRAAAVAALLRAQGATVVPGKPSGSGTTMLLSQGMAGSEHP
jgi:hypothetical protein